MIAIGDALLSSTTTIWWNSHARTPSPLVGRLRYGPKWQVQGDPVTLEKSSPNQTTWAGVPPRPHHHSILFFNISFHAVKATVNPPIPQTLVKWPVSPALSERESGRCPDAFLLVPGPFPIYPFPFLPTAATPSDYPHPYYFCDLSRSPATLSR